MEPMKQEQRRLIRLLPGLEGCSYRERLNRFGLFSPEPQRLRGDFNSVSPCADADLLAKCFKYFLHLLKDSVP